jgi:transposase
MMTREEIRAVYNQGPEAVIALVEQLYAALAQHQEQIAQLQGRAKGLEDRLATTSRASHKPPSSDSFVNERRSLREPSRRKSGGQPGHPGVTLEAVAEPDQTLLHETRQCTVCAEALAETEMRIKQGISGIPIAHFRCQRVLEYAASLSIELLFLPPYSTSTKYKNELKLLLTLNFQTFEKLKL